MKPSSVVFLQQEAATGKSDVVTVLVAWQSHAFPFGVTLSTDLFPLWLLAVQTGPPDGPVLLLPGMLPAWLTGDLCWPSIHSEHLSPKIAAALGLPSSDNLKN